MIGRRRAGDLAPNPEMWRALDHGTRLRAILKDFYNRVYDDERLAPFFEGVTKEHVIGKQYSFLYEKLTGEPAYFGERPRNAHHWMVISDELFDYRERLLADCMRDHGLPDKHIEEWCAMDEVFRKQIVKAEPFGRKIRGVELPLDGYESLVLSVGAACDGCEGPVSPGEQVQYHRRTGRAYCQTCRPSGS